MLKPGGRLVLSCPPATAELPLWIYELLLPNHGEGPHRFLSTREVKGLLHAAGLELERHESTLFIPAGRGCFGAWIRLSSALRRRRRFASWASASSSYASGRGRGPLAGTYS